MKHISNNVSVEFNKNIYKAIESILMSLEHDEDISAVSVIIDLTEEELNEYRENKRHSPRYKEATFKCADCVVGFESKADWDWHVIHHDKVNGEYCCRVCRFRFSKREYLEKHLTGHYKLYKCTVCKFKCAERLSFRRHCDRNHHPRRCRTCGITFQTRSQASEHRIRVHSTKKITCQVCSKRFYNNSQLQTHMLSHGPEPLFECEICHKKLRSASGIKRHRHKHKHQTGQEAYCMECKIQFKSKLSYIRHLKKSLKHVTPENLKYRCDECGKGFLSQRNLLDHINLSHTETCSLFCPDCDKGFHTKISLRSHILNLHARKDHQKSKVCSVCRKVFKYASALKEHMKMHTGARPYTCDVCSTSFACKSILNTHQDFCTRN